MDDLVVKIKKLKNIWMLHIASLLFAPHIPLPQPLTNHSQMLPQVFPGPPAIPWLFPVPKR
jgi:hypothetical protein